MNATYTTSANIFRYTNGYSQKVGFSESDLGVTSGQWHHVKLVRNGSTITPYVDNVAKTGKTVSDTLTHFQIAYTKDFL